MKIVSLKLNWVLLKVRKIVGNESDTGRKNIFEDGMRAKSGKCPDLLSGFNSDNDQVVIKSSLKECGLVNFRAKRLRKPQPTTAEICCRQTFIVGSLKFGMVSVNRIITAMYIKGDDVSNWFGMEDISWRKFGW
ncbi:hypothetical protein CEXT_700481 [Caerostris extrusa]|uniref:Uncharacterized protein n=1 Tax=Caerostris extrusa TaxID=172846 RepID=A0AAV4RX34_CAEEX|nr:hypothetical protein CEXT_700481 [Caerostris extrusa]